LSGPAPEVEAFLAYLRAKGHKVTPQRKGIAVAAFSTHAHFTSEQLYEIARSADPEVGRVTVYRTLEHLVASGMVEELSIAKGVSTYEHTAGHSHHDHLVCLRCGKVTEFQDERVENALHAAAESSGWTPGHHFLKAYGICPACSGPAGLA
jgi:Fur family ferric uptake transcriptional regulator